MGTLFGSELELHKEVLKDYLKHMSFKNTTMLTALRYFLSNFEMPGEGQKVE